jgi:DNA-binding winged helix-turn-helix (wHTH) protein
MRDGASVPIGGRAFDVLLLLLEYRGKVVDHNSIMVFTWPKLIVDPINVRFQVAALRRALGPDRDMLKTVNGRGYVLAEDCTVFSRHTGTGTAHMLNALVEHRA